MTKPQAQKFMCKVNPCSNLAVRNGRCYQHQEPKPQTEQKIEQLQKEHERLIESINSNLAQVADTLNQYLDHVLERAKENERKLKELRDD